MPLFSQLEIEEVTSTSSTCQKNGQIEVMASGGVEPYSYALIAPSTIERPNQSSNTFGSLLPGDYTVRVTDSSLPTPVVVTSTTTVVDAYTEPSVISVTTTKSSCPNTTDGSATINLSGNETALPINFTLYEGSTAMGTVIAGPQQSNVFNNLSSGQYTVLAVDGCSIQEPFTFLIEALVDDFTTGYFGHDYACTQALVNIQTFTGGMAPYTYTVTNNDDNTIFSSGSYTPTNQVPVPYDANFTLTFTDACGTQTTQPGFIPNNPIGNVTTSGGCGNLSTTVNLISGGFVCTDIDYCYRLVGETDYTCQASNVFSNLPDGDYEYKITDNCCEIDYIGGFSVASPTPTVSLARFDEGCLPGTNTFTLNFDGFGDNVNVELVSATPDYTYVDQNGITQTVTANFSQGTTNFNIFKNLRLELGSVPVGTYSFIIRDDCGNAIPYDLEVSPNDVVMPEYFVEYTPACSGNAELNFGVRSGGGRDLKGFAGGTFVVVKAADGTELYRRNRLKVGDVNTLSLAPGTYTVDFSLSSRARNTLYGSCPDIYTRTIEVANVLPPDLSVTEFYRCVGVDGTIVAGVINGAAPFQYRIRELGESTWGSYQTSAVFTGLDNTKIYEIEVFDSCSRNNIKQVEAGGVLSDPIIDATYNCISTSGSATKLDLSTTQVYGANYEWTNGSGSVVGTSREITIDPLMVGETYTVDVSIPSESGVCVAANSTYSIQTVSCSQILPIELSDFSADFRGEFIQLSWTSQTEIDHNHFELERSENGTNWTSIHLENGRGGDLPYTYRYDDYESGFGANYYRLKIVSTSEEVEYSPILLVNRDFPNNVITVMPNPSYRGTTITVSLPEDMDADSYTLYNISGQKVAEDSISGKKFLVLSADLVAGVYYFICKNGNGKGFKPMKIIVM